MKAKNPILEMLAASVLTKNSHPGYMVYADRGNGEQEIGPYASKEIALAVASEFPGAYALDMETGEIL